jgi:hypothetical protein
MHIYDVDSGDFSLAITTAKTILQVVLGSTRRLSPKEFKLSFNSISPSDPPVFAQWRIQSTAGTSSAFTPLPWDQADPAAIFTARNTFTVEPTDVGPLGGGAPFRLTPVGGLLIYQWEPLAVELAVSTRVGLVLTSPNALSSCRGVLSCQE